MSVRHLLVLADGPVDPVAEIDAAWPGWSDGIDLVIAADGGARHAAALGRRIDRWVGDGDSIEPGLLDRLAADGVPLQRAPTDKDETDAELALLAGVAADPARVTVLGALGGARVDHELGNVWLLAHPALAGRDARLVAALRRRRPRHRHERAPLPAPEREPDRRSVARPLERPRRHGRGRDDQGGPAAGRGDPC